MAIGVVHDLCCHCKQTTRWTCQRFAPDGDPWKCDVCGKDPTDFTPRVGFSRWQPWAVLLAIAAMFAAQCYLVGK